MIKKATRCNPPERTQFELNRMERLLLWVGYVLSAIALRFAAPFLQVKEVWGVEYLRGRPPTETGVSILIFAGCLGLVKPGLARYLGLAGMAVLSLLWFPSIMNLAGEPMSLLQWRNLLVIALYFASVSFVILYPMPVRWWMPRVLAGMLVIPIFIASGTAACQVVDYFKAEAKVKPNVFREADRNTGFILPKRGA